VLDVCVVDAVDLFDVDVGRAGAAGEAGYSDGSGSDLFEVHVGLPMA
jgi:hypothetical protein